MTIRHVVPHNVQVVKQAELAKMLKDSHVHAVWLQIVPSLSVLGDAYIKAPRTDVNKLISHFEGLVGEFEVQRFDHDIYIGSRVHPRNLAVIGVNVRCTEDRR